MTFMGTFAPHPKRGPSLISHVHRDPERAGAQRGEETLIALEERGSQRKAVAARIEPIGDRQRQPAAIVANPHGEPRSDERRVGKGGGSTSKSQWYPKH